MLWSRAGERQGAVFGKALEREWTETAPLCRIGDTSRIEKGQCWGRAAGHRLLTAAWEPLNTSAKG